MVRRPFLDLVRQRVVILDGAMGATLQTFPLDLNRDWRGQENCCEILNLTRPDLIEQIHEGFLAVGCDGVETNSFGGSRIVLAEAGLVDQTVEINRLSAQIARRACDRFETPDRPRYVIGSVGPGTKIASLGQTHWDEMEHSFFEQIRGLLEGGVDVLLFETQQDLLAIKCAIAAANRAFAVVGRRVPIMAQASMDQQNGRQMLTGSDATALVAAIQPFDEADVLGLNCAFGPYELTETVRYLCQTWPRFVSVLPNAGLPVYVNGKAHFPMTPPDFTKGVMRFVEEFGVNIVGGCCGTTAEHLKLLCEAVGFRPPKDRHPAPKPQLSSLISAVDIRQETSYLIVA